MGETQLAIRSRNREIILKSSGDQRDNRTGIYPITRQTVGFPLQRTNDAQLTHQTEKTDAHINVIWYLVRRKWKRSNSESRMSLLDVPALKHQTKIVTGIQNTCYGDLNEKLDRIGTMYWSSEVTKDDKRQLHEWWKAGEMMVGPLSRLITASGSIDGWQKIFYGLFRGRVECWQTGYCSTQN